MTTIIYGPMGCGKTTNAERLRAAFGCDRVVDGWQPFEKVGSNDLVLTAEDMSGDPRAIRFDDAMARLGRKH